MLKGAAVSALALAVLTADPAAATEQLNPRIFVDGQGDPTSLRDNWEVKSTKHESSVMDLFFLEQKSTKQVHWLGYYDYAEIVSDSEVLCRIDDTVLLGSIDPRSRRFAITQRFNINDPIPPEWKAEDDATQGENGEKGDTQTTETEPEYSSSKETSESDTSSVINAYEDDYQMNPEVIVDELIEEELTENNEERSLNRWVIENSEDSRGMKTYFATHIWSGEKKMIGIYDQVRKISDSQLVCIQNQNILLVDFDPVKGQIRVQRQVKLKQPIPEDWQLSKDEMEAGNLIVEWDEIHKGGDKTSVRVDLSDGTVTKKKSVDPGTAIFTDPSESDAGNTNLVRYVSGFSGFGDIIASFQIDEHQVSNVQFLSDRILIAELVVGKQGVFQFSAKITKDNQKAQYLGEYSEMKESLSRLIGISDDRKTVTVFKRHACGNVQLETSVKLKDHSVSNIWGSNEHNPHVFWIESDEQGRKKLVDLNTKTKETNQLELDHDLRGTSCNVNSGDQWRFWCKGDGILFVVEAKTGAVSKKVQTDWIELSEGIEHSGDVALIIPKDKSENIILNHVGLPKKLDGSKGNVRQVKWISEKLFAFQIDNQPWKFRSIWDAQLDIPSLHTGNDNHKEWRIGTRISLADLINIDQSLLMNRDYSFLQFGTMIYQVKWDYQGADHNPLMQDYQVESIEWDRHHPVFPEQNPDTAIPYSGLARIKWIRSIHEDNQITPTLIIQKQKPNQFLVFDPEFNAKSSIEGEYSRLAAMSASDIAAMNVNPQSVDHWRYQGGEWQLVNSVKTDSIIPDDWSFHWDGQYPFIHFIQDDTLIRVRLEDADTQSDPIPSGFKTVPNAPLLLRIAEDSFRVIDARKPKIPRQYRINERIESVHFSPDFRHATVVSESLLSHVWMVDLPKKLIGTIDGSNIFDRRVGWFSNDLFFIRTDGFHMESTLRYLDHPNTPIQSPQHSNQNYQDWQVGTVLNMVDLIRDKEMQIQSLDGQNRFQVKDQVMEVEWLTVE